MTPCPECLDGWITVDGHSLSCPVCRGTGRVKTDRHQQTAKDRQQLRKKRLWRQRNFTRCKVRGGLK